LPDLAQTLLPLWQSLRGTSPAEIVAVVTGLAYVLLTVRRNRWCWVAGGISSLILAVLAAQSRLPMQSGLQAWYVVMSVYGWLQWSQPAAGRIVLWSAGRHLAGVIASLAVAALAARWLATETQAAWPLLDAATTTLSLFATWQVARMVRENWLYWIVIDAVSLVLYAAQGLALTAVLFAIYLVVAVAGYIAWRRQWRQQTST
jgi:nicotinamide mononucleotide transporter